MHFEMSSESVKLLKFFQWHQFTNGVELNAIIHFFFGFNYKEPLSIWK